MYLVRVLRHVSSVPVLILLKFSGSGSVRFFNSPGSSSVCS
jgi:hypothetical protein